MNRRSFLASGIALGGATLGGNIPAGTAASRMDSTTRGLGFMSARQIARMIRDGKVSSLEVTTHILERIQRFKPNLNAFATLTAETAIAQAKAADQARARGKVLGPLHGVPVTVKDAFSIAGVRTTAGAKELGSNVATSDSAVVERLRKAGVVILGNTNVAAWLSDWQSYNEMFGTTNNPWDVSRTSGGSSGGEAAALAGGLTYLGVGSDIGGSIRIPSHFCGTYGHKSSLGLVSLRGHVPPPPNVSPLPPPNIGTAGPMTRTAGDLRTLLEVLAGPDGDERKAYSWSLPRARRKQVREYRIGYVFDDPSCPVTPEVREVLERAIAALRKAGVTVTEGWPQGVDPSAQFYAYFYLFWATFAFEAKDDQLAALWKSASDSRVSIEAIKSHSWSTPKSIDQIRARAWSAPLKAFQEVELQRMAARAVWQDYFRSHDAFLMPTGFAPAFTHDHSAAVAERKIITDAGPRNYYDFMFWISFALVSGLPATTAPVGLTAKGLPVGAQILGPYLEDGTPIDLAERLAELIGGFQAPKGYA